MAVRGGLLGVGTAAGLVFFAFAGYARIATLGEEVRNPERTLPRAILIALGAALVTYLLVAVALLVGLGPNGWPSSRRRWWRWSTPAGPARSGCWSGWARRWPPGRRCSRC